MAHSRCTRTDLQRSLTGYFLVAGFTPIKVFDDKHQLSTCAYLELTEPDLPTTVAGLVQTGVNAIRIVPMFLGVGRHAREDLPLLLQDLIIQQPGVTFELRKAIGEEPEMTRAMAAIALKSNP